MNKNSHRTTLDHTQKDQLQPSLERLAIARTLGLSLTSNSTTAYDAHIHPPQIGHNVHNQRIHLRLLRRPQGTVSPARLLLCITAGQGLLQQRRLPAPQPVHPALRGIIRHLAQLSLRQPVPAHAHLQPAIWHTKLPLRRRVRPISPQHLELTAPLCQPLHQRTESI